MKGRSKSKEQLVVEAEEMRREIAYLREQSRKADSMFHLVVDTMPIGVLVCDVAGNIIKANQVANSLMGGLVTGDAYGLRGSYTLHCMDGNPFPPDSLPMARALKLGETTNDMEILVKRNDGSEVVILATGSPMFDESGRVSGAVAVFRDITGSKKLEEELMLFSEMVECAPDGVQITDPQGYIVYSNKAIEEIYGISPAECQGKHVNEMNAEEDPVFAEMVIIPTIKKTGRWSGELMIRHIDGRVFPVSLNTSLVKNGQGIPIAMVGIIRDITESKRLQEELQMHRANLEKKVEERTRDIQRVNEKLRQEIVERRRVEKALMLLEERFSKVFYADTALLAINSLVDGRYIDVNDAFLAVTGYSREEVIGHTLSELNIWESNNESEASLFSEQVRNLDVNFHTKSGDLRIGLVSTAVIDLEGERCLFTATRDVTEQRHLQKEVTRLERLNLVGEMAAGMGHEIRNPMTAVRGFIQLLGIKDELSNYQHYFELMVGELDRANSIITEFLIMAKNKNIDRKMHNLNSIIKAIAPLIQSDAMLGDKSIDFELATVQDLFIDEKEIRQLIFNMVRNGLEAMSSGGILTIKTYMENREVVMAIRDQGMGIKPELIEKLGTPFLTTKEQGTGLGLAVCYSIAARHNATINIETGPGGTTFFIRFRLQGN